MDFNFATIPSNTGVKYVFDNNLFKRYATNKHGTKYVSCEVPMCTARGVIKNKTFILRKKHSHEYDKKPGIAALLFKVRCRKRAAENPSESLRAIFDEECATGVSAEGSSVSFDDVKDSMYKRRRKQRKSYIIPVNDELQFINAALDWQPPSEAEHKILEARRERQNKISKLIGDYLLKGYKMLASVCPECETILMRSREGEDYCVACSELDSDGTKDDPVLSNTAAHRQAQEQLVKLEPPDTDFELVPCNGGDTYTSLSPAAAASGDHHTSTTPNHESVVVLPTGTRVKSTAGGSRNNPNVATSTGTEFVAANVQCCRDETVNHESVVNATNALYDRLDWATAQLRQTHSVEGSVRLCDLIRGCADAIVSLRRVQHLND